MDNISTLLKRIQVLERLIFAQKRFMVVTHYGGGLGHPVHPIESRVVVYPSSMSYEDCFNKTLEDLNQPYFDEQKRVEQRRLDSGGQWDNIMGTYSIIAFYQIF